MVKINLLPWREELRQQRQRDFLIAIGLSVLVTAGLLGLMYMHIEGLKAYQEKCNQILQNEISELDSKIVAIKDIETKKGSLLQKIDLIQGLQKSRPQIVHLFDEIAKRTPEGVYIVEMTQKGTALSLEGKAQSNARVSALMREIENSAWITAPKLQVIKGLDKPVGTQKSSGGQLSEFSLQAEQSMPTDDARAGGVAP